MKTPTWIKYEGLITTQTTEYKGCKLLVKQYEGFWLGKIIPPEGKPIIDYPFVSAGQARKWAEQTTEEWSAFQEFKKQDIPF